VYMSGVKEKITRIQGGWAERENEYVGGYVLIICALIYWGVYMCGASERIMTHSSENAIPRNIPNRETHFPRYKFKWSQNRDLNMYREKPRNLDLSIWWISEMYCYQWNLSYGVATTSRLFKIIGLFCKRALQKRRHSAKETYNLKEPTNRSHPIVGGESEMSGRERTH